MCAVTRRDPELRQKILGVTRQAIIENGINNTSLAEIARLAGISKGTLFYYYATKSDLIFDVTDQHFQQTTHRLNDWVDQVHSEVEAREILSVVFHSIVEDELRGKLHHYLIEQAITENGNLKERFAEKYQEWLGVLAKGLSRIFPPTIDRETLTYIIITCLDGLVIQSILGTKQVPIEPVVAYLADSAARFSAQAN
ncbi:MAG TPA: TetR/AcrR family transcriptional regulator [Anaerolineaceae bacterium]|jgi:AcrR family transcriptional regulator|nr:TetR/AcrR family transcriptional regulator [Anaerolineaceae bacterium]